MVFRATETQKIGSYTFKKGQPVLYIDSAKTSTLEGAATTVYATGGRGNTRLITWEGEKTLTFTVEDALLSPLGFSMLSGAGLFNVATQPVHVHHTVKGTISKASTAGAKATVDMTDSLQFLDENGREAYNAIDLDAPLFVIKMEDDSLTNTFLTIDNQTTSANVEASSNTLGAQISANANDHYYEPKYTVDQTTGIATVGTKAILTFDSTTSAYVNNGDTVFVDCYMLKKENKAMELQIDAEHFGGYYYVEADTLVRKQSTGKDMPAILTLPLVKIQSNFTFTMASSGDPSTFTFTMDAMPGYTYFNKKQKVLCVMQIIDESSAEADRDAVMRHGSGYAHSNGTGEESYHDSFPVSG